MKLPVGGGSKPSAPPGWAPRAASEISPGGLRARPPDQSPLGAASAVREAPPHSRRQRLRTKTRGPCVPQRGSVPGWGGGGALACGHPPSCHSHLHAPPSCHSHLHAPPSCHSHLHKHLVLQVGQASCRTACCGLCLSEHPSSSPRVHGRTGGTGAGRGVPGHRGEGSHGRGCGVTGGGGSG